MHHVSTIDVESILTFKIIPYCIILFLYQNIRLQNFEEFYHQEQMLEIILLLNKSKTNAATTMTIHHLYVPSIYHDRQFSIELYQSLFQHRHHIVITAALHGIGIYYYKYSAFISFHFILHSLCGWLVVGVGMECVW